MTATRTEEAGVLSTARLEAFSDGVFAIAITLLVLDLAVPNVGHGQLGRALRDEWPQFASFLVSFLIIGIIWVNHHTLFAQVGRVDRVLLFFNLLLLLSVVLIPFPTALLARYIQAGADSHIAAVFYSATMLGMAVSFSLIWAHVAWGDDMLVEGLPPQAARAAFPRFSSGTIIYVFTVGVALVNAVACLVIHGLLALYYVFDWTAIRALRKSSGEE